MYLLSTIESSEPIQTVEDALNPVVIEDEGNFGQHVVKGHGQHEPSTTSGASECWEDNLCLHLILIAVLDFGADLIMTLFFR